LAIQQRAQSIAYDLWAAGKILSEARKLVPRAKWHFGRLLAENAERLPNQVALRVSNECFTWREFNMEANRYAAFFLRQGLRRGDVVALLMDNRPDFLFIELGLNKIGVVTALINTQLAAEPLVHAVRAAHPRRLVVGSEHVERLRAVAADLPLVRRERAVLVVTDGLESTGDWPVIDAEVDVCPVDNPRPAHWPTTGDVMSYLYTSGTTGLPKPAVITNRRSLIASCGFSRVALECEPDDVVYTALPFYHGSAQWAGLGACLYSGATLAFRRKFSASRFWDDVSKFGATHFLYIGELCRYLLNQPEHPLERQHRLRMAVGNGLRAEIWQRFQERFCIPLIREFYGATEGNVPLLNHEGRAGMIGRLRIGHALVRCDLETGEVRRNARGYCEEVREGETGLLLGHIGPLMSFDGYLDERDTRGKILTHVFRPGDRYFNSGDLLTLHSDRWVSFADRVGDTFRWKGENVSTNEVAAVLNRAPGVVESVVYGVSVPGAEGRAGMAALKTNPDFDLDAFAAYVIERLATYQRPQFIRLDAALRTTATLKHQTVDYRTEGFDPERVSAPLYLLRRGTYHPLDTGVYRRLQRRELTLE
jgi:acyl-CoA synthetase (AMP-forming)/AMP-acid ligase II